MVEAISSEEEASGTAVANPPRLPVALLALTAGAFGIGVTEFVIMGLLLEVSADLAVSVSAGARVGAGAGAAGTSDHGAGLRRHATATALWSLRLEKVAKNSEVEMYSTCPCG